MIAAAGIVAYFHHAIRRGNFPTAVLILLPALMIGLYALGWDYSHPGNGVLSKLMYTPEENAQRLAVMQAKAAEDALRDELSPAQRSVEVTCPDGVIWKSWTEQQQKRWHDYYASFAKPAPMGEECWYVPEPRKGGFARPMPDEKS